MKNIKKAKNKEKLKESFWKLVETIEFDDECYPEPEKIEGGTRLVHFTLLIRLKSLERAHLSNPEIIEAYLQSHRFFRSRDGLISTSRMEGDFSDHFKVLNGVNLHCYTDYFLADGTCFWGYTEESAKEHYDEMFGLNALFFDFIRLYYGAPVIRLKPGIEEILDDPEKVKDYVSQLAAPVLK